MSDYLKDLENKISSLESTKEYINKNLYKLRKDKEEYIIYHKLYETDLSKYAGKKLDRVSIIYEKDGQIKIENMFEEIAVTESGKIIAYEYGEFEHWGIEWSEEKNSYIICSCFSDNDTTINILGFFNITEERQ